MLEFIRKFMHENGFLPTDIETERAMIEAWKEADKRATWNAVNALSFDPATDVILVTMPQHSKQAEEGIKAHLEKTMGAKKIIIKPPNVSVEKLGPSILSKGVRIGYELGVRRFAWMRDNRMYVGDPNSVHKLLDESLKETPL